MSPSEQAGCVDVWVGIIFIVRDLNVVPHAVIYPWHPANQSPKLTALACFESQTSLTKPITTQLNASTNSLTQPCLSEMRVCEESGDLLFYFRINQVGPLLLTLARRCYRILERIPSTFPVYVITPRRQKHAQQCHVKALVFVFHW